MRIPLFVLLLLLKQALWSQQEELPVKDSIPPIQEVDLKLKDTLTSKERTLQKKQKDKFQTKALTLFKNRSLSQFYSSGLFPLFLTHS